MHVTWMPALGLPTTDRIRITPPPVHGIVENVHHDGGSFHAVGRRALRRVEGTIP